MYYSTTATQSVVHGWSLYCLVHRCFTGTFLPWFPSRGADICEVKIVSVTRRQLLASHNIGWPIRLHGQYLVQLSLWAQSSRPISSPAVVWRHCHHSRRTDSVMASLVSIGFPHLGIGLITEKSSSLSCNLWAPGFMTQRLRINLILIIMNDNILSIYAHIWYEHWTMIRIVPLHPCLYTYVESSFSF